MPIELPVAWIVGLNVAGWLVLQCGLAWGFTQMPARWFHPGPPLAWENDGRFYERWLAIKRWKDWLPDGSKWFAGGFAKSTLSASELTPKYLERFLRETWRGELCHWLAIAFAPAFFIWNPWWGDLVIFAYALSANLPCILVQRYNRIRLARLLASKRRPPRTR